MQKMKIEALIYYDICYANGSMLIDNDEVDFIDEMGDFIESKKPENIENLLKILNSSGERFYVKEV